MQTTFPPKTGQSQYPFTAPHNAHREQPSYNFFPSVQESLNSALDPIEKLKKHYSPYPSIDSNRSSSSYSPVNISYWSCGGNSYYSGGRENNERNIGLGILISFIAIGAGFFVGKELGNVANANLALKHVDILSQNTLNEEEISVVRHARAVLTDTKDSAVKSAILKIVALAGLVIGAVGAFISGGGSLIALGLIVSLLSTLVLVIQAGVNYSTDFNGKKHEDLSAVARNVQQLIQRQ